MSRGKKVCPICNLNAEAREAFDEKLALGLPATALADFMITLGSPCTPQQIYSHRKHSKPTKNQTISLVNQFSPLISNVSTEGLSNDIRQEKLLNVALQAVDALAEQFNANNNLRTARMLKEMIDLADGLVRGRMSRETIPDPILNVTVAIGSLEDRLDQELQQSIRRMDKS
ncbi:hypothetical protein [Nostoc sp. PA-18-2419]|uniref:hypothetical protein n=1 Tax=Nostoc sp. PA-18-2419 TaxID=2575443 RepID=UPI00110990A6|nr:hypothetical protein [Nostoc sp. PA-18-2419]